MSFPADTLLSSRDNLFSFVNEKSLVELNCLLNEQPDLPAPWLKEIFSSFATLRNKLALAILF